MADLIMPIRNDLATYRFQIDLESRLYTFRFVWNQRENRYYMTILNEAGDVVISGKKIIINYDLLGRYNNPGLPPGKFVALDISGKGQQPSREVFANDVKLIYRESV